MHDLTDLHGTLLREPIRLTAGPVLLRRRRGNRLASRDAPLNVEAYYANSTDKDRSQPRALRASDKRLEIDPLSG